MNNEQHQEDTKYVQWQDGMYVMLYDLLCDYEKALVEDSLRSSGYLYRRNRFLLANWDNALGVYKNMSGSWCDEGFKIKLTRAQALYIATGDTDI
jgi:hypothetical protein